MKDDSVSYELIRKIRLRYWRINIRDDCSIVVTVGLTASKRAIMGFLDNKRKWIDKVIRMKGESAQRLERLSSEKKGCLLYRGEWFRVEAGQGDGKVFVDEDSKRIAVNIGNGQNLRDYVNKWQRNTAREVINEAIERISKQVDVDYNRVFIRNQKSRWGCCSPKKNLSINWRLIKAPSYILEYVVTHELCHIKEPSHSRKFWSLLGMFYPDYKGARSWFKENGQLLYLDVV